MPKEKNTKDEQENMQAAVQNASYNMIVQVLFRIATFSMNAILLRYLTKEALGIMNVRLMLLYTTTLFVSREAFRKACLTQIESQINHKRSSIKNMINVTWCCLTVGICSCTFFSVIWVKLLDQPTLYIHQYNVATMFIAISAFIEISVEPFWIIGQRNGMINLKAITEGIFLCLRCFLTTVLVIISPDNALMAFGASFIIAATVYAISYIGYFYYFMKDPFRRKSMEIENLINFMDLFPDFFMQPILDWRYVRLIVSFYKQSILKQFLTEGERYVMTIFGTLTFSQQGIYDVINNLGSLAARFIFLPIEEAYYTYFSQNLIRGRSAKDQDTNKLKQAITSLSLALKFVSLVGITIFVFGYAYSRLLLNIYGGKILSHDEGTSLLRAYCLYVLIIAINGLTECFMFACMSQKEVDQYNYKMLMFSCVFLTASLLLTRYMGSIGFIFANCLNMLLRILQSVLFIQDYFKGTDAAPLSSIIPSKGVAVLFASSFIVTSVSESFFSIERGLFYQFIHVCIGGICLLLVLLGVYFTEHTFVEFVKSFILRKNKAE